MATEIDSAERGDEMTPMQFFEGSMTKPERLGKQHELGDRLADRRLAALALAVRQHEDAGRRRSASPARPNDLQLYRRLRQICGAR